MKFSDDAVLQAAATLAAAQVQAHATLMSAGLATEDQRPIPHLAVVSSVRSVLSGLLLLEQQAKEGDLDMWPRFRGA
jgi:hypothetical protein